ncbi:hypothetical protein V22_06720 [Calycomorphotria hydatis]|uniref:Uncharacterized protein n=1 Tax=Calycomorphotria hydatis TaxID=2528027 RepID=A0A517T511_9PLAN|nr:hypothetical protein V22_06720 [Calycomorphotria hydatis]
MIEENAATVVMETTHPVLATRIAMIVTATTMAGGTKVVVEGMKDAVGVVMTGMTRANPERLLRKEIAISFLWCGSQSCLSLVIC